MEAPVFIAIRATEVNDAEEDVKEFGFVHSACVPLDQPVYDFPKILLQRRVIFDERNFKENAHENFEGRQGFGLLMRERGDVQVSIATRGNEFLQRAQTELSLVNRRPPQENLVSKIADMPHFLDDKGEYVTQDLCVAEEDGP